VTADDYPASMARLPRGGRHRLPVPYVASWSCERWHAIRHDPVVGDVAIFTAGRYARGRALFGVTNEPRQRECVMLRRCGVCGQPITGPGWLPNHDRLIEQTADIGAQRLRVTHEPPCCLPCARWSATGCLAIRGRTPDLLRVDAFVPIAQRIDPSRAPSNHDARFDGPDDSAERERLGRIARRHGGAVGYVKLGLTSAEAVSLDAVG
jgi:hypothetical protein